MRLRNLVFRQRRKSLEQQRPDLIFPEQVYNFLMREDGICKRATAAHQQDTEDECNNWRFSHVSFFLNEGEPEFARQTLVASGAVVVSVQ